MSDVTTQLILEKVLPVVLGGENVNIPVKSMKGMAQWRRDAGSIITKVVPRDVKDFIDCMIRDFIGASQGAGKSQEVNDVILSKVSDKSLSDALLSVLPSAIGEVADDLSDLFWSYDSDITERFESKATWEESVNGGMQLLAVVAIPFSVSLVSSAIRAGERLTQNVAGI